MAKEKKRAKNTHAQSGLRHRRHRNEKRSQPESIPLRVSKTWIFGWCEMNLFCFFFAVFFLSGFKKFTGGHARHAKVDFDIVCDVYLWWSQPLVTQNCTSPKSPVAFAQATTSKRRMKKSESREEEEKNGINTSRIFIKMCHGWDLHFAEIEEEKWKEHRLRSKQQQ